VRADGCGRPGGDNAVSAGPDLPVLVPGRDADPGNHVDVHQFSERRDVRRQLRGGRVLIEPSQGLGPVLRGPHISHDRQVLPTGARGSPSRDAFAPARTIVPAQTPNPTSRLSRDGVTLGRASWIKGLGVAVWPWVGEVTIVDGLARLLVVAVLQRDDR
jgi:hypothetical protein